MNIFLKSSFFLIMLLTPMITLAALSKWDIIPSESSIIFTGIQNDAPSSGRFKKFTGDINIDPKDMRTGNVHIVIDMNSVSTSYSEFASTLRTTDWFDVKIFPKAIFDSTQLTQTGDNQYQANGTLTIRDKSVPVVLHFTAEPLSDSKVKITGETTLKRTAFNIGNGEWADTKTVKDDVRVDFTLTAKRE